MFLPQNWPSYFSKSKGCFVWDLENKKYIDMKSIFIKHHIWCAASTHPDEEKIILKTHNLLKQKGIKLKLYTKVLKKIDNLK